MAHSVPMAERLERHIERDPNSGCWLWTGWVNPQGYGVIRFWQSGKASSRLAHRISWETVSGPIPKWTGPHSLSVCHRCDTPACINPDHLFLGTHADNNRDMYAKKRGRNSRKLTPEQQACVRADSRPQHIIAKEYRVSQTCISSTKAGYPPRNKNNGRLS